MKVFERKKVKLDFFDVKVNLNSFRFFVLVSPPPETIQWIWG